MRVRLAPARFDALRAARRSAELTQEQLASLTGLHCRTIRGLETGKIDTPHFNSLDKIAIALNLDQRARGEFLASWGVVDDGRLAESASIFGGSDEPAATLQSLTQEGIRSCQPISRIERVRVAGDHTIVSTDVADLFAARVDHVERRPIFFVPGSDVDLHRLRLTRLQNCQSGRVYEFPEQGAKAFELLLQPPLRKGETRLVNYLVQYSAATMQQANARDEPTTRVACGFFRPKCNYLLEITFELGALPTSCVQLFQRTPTSSSRTVRPLAVNGDGTVHLVLSNAQAGAHGIQWAWQ